MKVRAPVVVLGWACGELGLAAGLLAFREQLIDHVLYFASTVPVLVFAAAAAWAARGRRPPQEYIRLPSGVGYLAVLAAGALVCGVGVIYVTWLVVVGILIMAYAVFGLWRSPRAPDPPPAVVDTPAEPRR